MPLRTDLVDSLPEFLAVFGSVHTWTPEAFKAITPDPLLYRPEKPGWERVPSISIQSFEMRKVWTRTLEPATTKVYRATESAWRSGPDRYRRAGVTYLAVLHTRATTMAAVRAFILREKVSEQVFTDALSPFVQYLLRNDR